jgi:hypothetical protein
MLAGFLHELIEKARRDASELDMLGAILAVTLRHYVKSLGREQAAMMFYSVADELAINDEGSEDDGFDGEAR